jgi:hypothetical protein
LSISTIHGWIIFLCVLPYVYIFFQFPGQVQPLAHFLSFLLLALTFRFKVNLSITEILIIAFSLFFIFYLYEYSVNHFTGSLRKSIGFLIGLPIYFVAKKISVNTLKRALIFAPVLYLFVAIIQMINLDFYLALGQLFFETRQSEIGLRGVASIAPEATDFGFICSYLLFLCYLIFAVSGPSKSLIFSVSILVACLFLSGSASGIISLLLWSFPIIFFGRKFFGRSLLLVLLLIILFNFLADIRGVGILYLALSNPESLLDTSFAHRATHNFVAFVGLFESEGFGYGSGAYTYVAPLLYDKFGLSYILGLNGHYTNAVYDTLNNHALSVFSQLTLEYGLFGLVYMLLIFYLAFKSSSAFKTPIVILMFLTWAQSFPSAFPLFWLILGISCNDNFKKKLQASVSK